MKEFLSINPAIPDGLNLECTAVNQDDFSTIICQALLSNDHLTGLRQ